MTKIFSKSQLAPRPYLHTLSENDSRNMKRLFSTAANKSSLWLVLNISKMEELKARLYHVHPLTFVESVFLNKDLQMDLEKVKEKGELIWGAFIRNVQRSFNEEEKCHNLFCHVSEFSQAIQRPQEMVLKHLDAKNIGLLLLEAI
jgi:hypothetical protein